MDRHLDADEIVDLATEPGVVPAEFGDHVGSCPDCQARLMTYGRVIAAADLARHAPELAELEPVPDGLRERVLASVLESGSSAGATSTGATSAAATGTGATDAGAASTAATGEGADVPGRIGPADRAVPVELLASGYVRDTVPPVEPGSSASMTAAESRASRHRGSRSRRRALTLLAAAVIGAVIGVGGGWLIGRDGSSTTSTTLSTGVLDPLQTHTTSGSVSLLQTASGREVKVSLTKRDHTTGFVEVWLLDTRNNDMVALGVLDGDHGSYAVPSALDLKAYDHVDVSAEPYDGNPLHSQDSLARAAFTAH